MPVKFVIDQDELNERIVEAEGGVIEFSLFLYQAITFGTPVKTGHARVNWLIDFANLVAKVLGTRPDPESGVEIPPPSGQALETWTADKGNIFIHNSVDYVEYLEEGRSDQADQGILLPALTAAQARFG